MALHLYPPLVSSFPILLHLLLVHIAEASKGEFQIPNDISKVSVKSSKDFQPH